MPRRFEARFAHADMFRSLLLIRAALNGWLGLYLLLSPFLTPMHRFVVVGYYAVVDGIFTLLLAVTIYRKTASVSLFGASIIDGLVRLNSGIAMIILHPISFFVVTRAFFMLVAAKVALVIGFFGSSYVGWMLWRRSDAESTRLKWLIFGCGAFTALFGLGLAFGSEIGLAAQTTVGAYALMMALVLAVGSMTPLSERSALCDNGNSEGVLAKSKDTV